jgi:hypothetical protein
VIQVLGSTNVPRLADFVQLDAECGINGAAIDARAVEITTQQQTIGY